jgi:hypothetical protein
MNFGPIVLLGQVSSVVLVSILVILSSPLAKVNSQSFDLPLLQCSRHNPRDCTFLPQSIKGSFSDLLALRMIVEVIQGGSAPYSLTSASVLWLLTPQAKPQRMNCTSALAIPHFAISSNLLAFKLASYETIDDQQRVSCASLHCKLSALSDN